MRLLPWDRTVPPDKLYGPLGLPGREREYYMRWRLQGRPEIQLQGEGWIGSGSDGGHHGIEEGRISSGKPTREWHADGLHELQKPPLATSMYSVSTIARGGDTLFLSTAEALASFSPERRSKLRRMRAFYTRVPRAMQKDGLRTATEKGGLAGSGNNDGDGEDGTGGGSDGGSTAQLGVLYQQGGSKGPKGTTTREVQDCTSSVSTEHPLVMRHPITGVEAAIVSPMWLDHLENEEAWPGEQRDQTVQEGQDGQGGQGKAVSAEVEAEKENKEGVQQKKGGNNGRTASGVGDAGNDDGHDSHDVGRRTNRAISNTVYTHEESQAVVESLLKASLPTVYRHVWKQGDFVVWDNRQLLHSATSNDGFSSEGLRLLHRIRLSSPDEPLGPRGRRGEGDGSESDVSVAAEGTEKEAKCSDSGQTCARGGGGGGGGDVRLVSFLIFTVALQVVVLTAMVVMGILAMLAALRDSEGGGVMVVLGHLIHTNMS